MLLCEFFRPQIGLVPGQAHSKVLVISNWRSAGSLISSIIAAYPGTLQVTQVLKIILGMHKVSARHEKATECIELLKRLLSCDFSFLNQGNKGHAGF